MGALVFLTLFLVTCYLQLKSRDFNPVIFWSVILTTSLVGTSLSDMMDRTLDLGYAKGSLLLVTCLVLLLAFTRVTCGTLSVTRITTRRHEILYWCAILVSNTLGTALGDFMADLGLSFGNSVSILGTCLLTLAILYYCSDFSRVVLFWLAFILTRPFGAEFGDFLTKSQGGLGFGTLGSSIVLFGMFIAFLITSMRYNVSPPDELAKA